MKISRAIRAGLEQVLLGVSNFSTTWFALRSLNYEDFAIFSLFWALSWGGLAVLSEFMISPNRVEAIKTRDSKPLIAVAIFTGMAGLSLWAFGFFRDFHVGLTVVTISLLAASLGFHCLRAVLQVSKKNKTILLCLTLFILNSSFLVALATLQTTTSIEDLVMSSALAHIVSLLLLVPYKSLSNDLKNQATRALLMAIKFGTGFGVSTLVRVLTYSIFFMLIVQIMQGSLGLAVFSSAAALIAPSQVFTAALSWVLFPDMVESHKKGFIRHAILRHLSIYTFVAIVSSVGLALIWPWWISSLIAVEEVKALVNGNEGYVLLLMFSAIVSAFPNAAFHTIKAQKPQLWISLSSGLFGLIILLLGANPILASAITYAFYTTVAVFSAWRLSREL